MKYIVLLRGINISGKNKVDMKTLKEELLKNNLNNVITYLNSGNIILETDLNKEELPLTECLKDTLERVLPYYNNEIKTHLLKGENVLIVAHGNSIRSIIKYIENISDEDIMNVEIPTAVPYIYELDNELNIINKTILK